MPYQAWPIIAKRAVAQCDNALKLHSDNLLQVKAERTKYAVLRDAEMGTADSASSYDGDPTGFLVDRSDMTATAPIPQNHVQPVDSMVVQREMEGTGQRSPALSKWRSTLYSTPVTPSKPCQPAPPSIFSAKPNQFPILAMFLLKFPITLILR
jgi:hypothetical protein